MDFFSDSSSSAGGDQTTNPFTSPPPPPPPPPSLPPIQPLPASSLLHLPIRSLVPDVLDLEKGNYIRWSRFFQSVFRQFGLRDHVNGSVLASDRLQDAKWMQSDFCIVSWLYSTITQEILDIVMQPDDTALHLWSALADLFLDNSL
ncbi:uncharacterized protein LOC104582413 [Brachypodium distachyon]|uniref:uncharacterized protein LOC104582413 n=1 Tax=Brachypodium distachyon TaxID=15368 RepID=UPI0005300272|nr:uncharacterized protein LOC104582413 [Brachypodium distachyon]|eukprot:XP_010230239.1 uncharacterized protein LOC104582413 [Brachypodium distachyon]